MLKWYKLDNAAKLFPSVSSKKNSSVYRLSAVLSEAVDGAVLQKATNMVLPRFPIFTVKLRRGLFWNYLEKNDAAFFVKKEEIYPCFTMMPRRNSGYLFKVMYFKNRISLEVFHALTDGSGAMEFLKSLLYYYEKLLGNQVEDEGMIRLKDETISESEIEDSFSRYYLESNSKRAEFEKAYKIKGKQFEIYGNNVVSGVIKVDEILAIAKAQGVTITSYIIALLIYSIGKSQKNSGKIKDPIVVAVPVNLRKPFPSETLRNFFGVVNIGVKTSEYKTFEELLSLVHKRLKTLTTKDNLQNFISGNVKLEQNTAARLVPLFIKHKFVSLGFNFYGEKRKTLTLTNMGNVTLPKKLGEKIESMGVTLYPTKRSPINCGMCSVNGKLVVTFARTLKESDIMECFFSFLAKEKDLDIEVYGNDWGHSNG
ncbi:MAG: alcohol acetyltransferase [Clostridiales bacterium]